MAHMIRTRPPQLDGRSTATQFLEEHDFLTQEVATLREHNASLMAQNAALLSETNMLREELARSDKDRTSLQGFAAGLATRLSVIQETIAIALRDAAAYRIKPEQKQEAQETAAPEVDESTKATNIIERDTAEVRGILSRLPPNSLMR